MSIESPKTASPLLSLTITPENGIGATGVGVAAANPPIPGLALMSGPGNVNIMWSIAGPLSANSAQLTCVGPLGNLSAATANYSILESTNFVLTCFAPGAPMQTYVAQVNVKIPSLRNRLVPPGAIGAWHTASGGSLSGWQSCGDTLAGRFLLGANITAASGQRTNSATHAHGMVTGSFSRSAVQTAKHTHTWPLKLVACDGNSSQIQAYHDSMGFVETGDHSHSVAITAKPKVDTTSATPTPLAPYFVVKFAQKE